ncbi:MAG: nuclear transport factor 2 family protein [Planctomycetes bacterium]|nr:nuclear transport factor 2 family protein [Planctomycetota bacterium]
MVANRIVLVLLLTLAACAAPPPSPPVPDLRAAVDAYYRDLSARDWGAFAGHFHPGAVLSARWTPPGADAPTVMMSNVAEFVAQAHLGPGSQPVFEEWPLSVDVRRQGDLAATWVRYGVRFGAPGALQEWTGIDAITWILHDGRWRISSMAWTGD